MPRQRTGLAILLAGALLGSAAMAAEDGASTEQASWRHTKQTFHYYGFTSAYTCGGLEDKVRFILRLFGARRDAKVFATGCERTSLHPSPSAWVTVEFDALEAGPVASGAETVAGQWTPIRVEANRPFDMGEGDCELMDHMRYVLLQGFAFKDLEYHATCVSHAQTLDSWGVRGQVLREAPAAAAR
jgi:hypothetical protein